MEFSNYTMQSLYFCNPIRELGCIFACMLDWGIGKNYRHCEENAQAGVAGVGFAMAKTSRATQRNRRCEAEQSSIAQAVKRSDAAIQENTLDCFTFVRNDMKSMANIAGSRDGGVKCQ